MAVPNESRGANYAETHDEEMTCDTISVTEDNKCSDIDSDIDDNGNDRFGDCLSSFREETAANHAIPINTRMTLLRRFPIWNKASL